MSRFAYEQFKGRQIQFVVEDTHLPEPAALLWLLHARDVLNGTVVDLSRGGTDARLFVVVEVQGLRQPCVLPAERILRTL